MGKGIKMEKFQPTHAPTNKDCPVRLCGSFFKTTPEGCKVYPNCKMLQAIISDYCFKIAIKKFKLVRSNIIITEVETRKCEICRYYDLCQSKDKITIPLQVLKKR